ncbi:MAG: DUF2220 family protein [Spirochaetia bacterium]|nr:DUF2220 family protein [Spirochaetia bacterium]
MKLVDLKQIKTRLIGQWEKGRFLKDYLDKKELFPLYIPLKGPNPSEMVDNFTEVKDWVQEIRKKCEQQDIPLEWKKVNHRQLGRNELPQKISFSSIQELALFLGKDRELKIFLEGFDQLRFKFPGLILWTLKYPFDLIKSQADLEKLISILEWRIENSKPLIFLRQLSLSGVDTKFIESYKRLLSQWFDIILNLDEVNWDIKGVSKFEERYGFLSRPELIRFRLLDPHERIGGFSDISVPTEEFSHYIPKSKRIFITENDVTGLAFPPLKDSMVVFGRGYNFENLVQSRWLHEKELWYWGDLDTHGFAILSQFRGIFPSVRSFLMDRETLMAHKVHWGEEKTPCTSELSHLTKDESSLYDELRFDSIKPNLRLEQEFIGFAYAEEIIRALL